MGRYGKTLPRDESYSTLADDGFMGVNLKIGEANPLNLPEGMARSLINKRCLHGTAETRGGMVTPKWANLVPAPWNGSAVYSDPSGGGEWLLIATGDAVWRMMQGRGPERIALPAGEAIAGPCELVQAFNVVVLFRGPDAAPLVWDGRLQSSFGFIPEAEAANVLSSIPNAVTAEFFADRLLVPFGRDEVAVSDILDYTHYDATLSQFRAATGNDELLVRVFPFNQTSVFLFKTHSVHRVINAYGNSIDLLASNAAIERIHSSVGCVARKSVAHVGGEVFFLDGTGVYRATPVLQTVVQVQPVPVSDPIEPLIRRINWPYAGNAVAAVHGYYYFLAVPLDGATINNAVLVFNTVSGHWEGYDTAAFAFGVSDFHVTNFNGARRLFAVDRANARVFVLGEGYTDQVGDATYPINDLIETRGFSPVAPGGIAGALRVSVALATWQPKYAIAVVADGVNEVTPLTPAVTRSRTKYAKPHGKPAYDITNANHDQLAPGREDYSVDPTAGVLFDDGLQLELKQEFLERRNVRGQGRWMTVRITGSQGAVDVRGVAIEEDETQRTTRIQQ